LLTCLQVLPHRVDAACVGVLAQPGLRDLRDPGLSAVVHAEPSGQLPCLRDRNRLRRDSRVTVSRTATASAISPATWPVSPGWTKAMAEEPETGLRSLLGTRASRRRAGGGRRVDRGEQAGGVAGPDELAGDAVEVRDRAERQRALGQDAGRRGRRLGGGGRGRR